MNFYNLLTELSDKHGLPHDINDFLDDPTRAEINDFDELAEILRENGFFDVEILYYNSAMKYLLANDNSLRDSLELADDMGYEVKDLNSELLASLLASEDLQYQFSGLEEEINEFLNQ